MRNWRPLDTAPKDGTRVLLYLPKPLGKTHIVIGHWQTRNDEAPRWSLELDSAHQEMPPEPSHWMPLPSPIRLVR